MKELTELIYREGGSLVGFADLQPLERSVRANLPFGISIACALDSEIISGIIHGPTMEYYSEYARINEILERISDSVVSFLEQRGYRAHAVRPTTESYNPDTLSVTLPHKTVATRAGLGWIGKCALLITREYGSAIRFASILTDMDVSVGKPQMESKCGECALCVDACPADAPSGNEWSIRKSRDEFFNASACREKAKELSKRIGLEKTICGICIVSCPWTQKYIQGSGLDF